MYVLIELEMIEGTECLGMFRFHFFSVCVVFFFLFLFSFFSGINSSASAQISHNGATTKCDWSQEFFPPVLTVLCIGKLNESPTSCKKTVNQLALCL